MINNVETIAKALKELGHPTRLTIFKRLVKSGYRGVPVGIIMEELNIPASTLSHHVSSLASAKLIKQRREGTTLYCVVEYHSLLKVITFLQEECCIDDEVSEYNESETSESNI
ncbi:ArsR/SmtB family transcription factor [Colwellia psychrerythraea]|uniref:Transcriptional regulator, ArsR family n=1 Tax=Colwellia psychrerythraea TaxID=28229 RepID=A0A099KTA1_COLPS|nr:metalloregulator ArsR/SmtB family transcription factor [Colwellia psychrerythraea]KGJ92903.1 transcriptional regulator, ArsR family [Colwellia psychrerythraea]